MKYFRNYLIYTTIFGLEVCWLYALSSLANKAVNDVLSIPLLLMVLPLSWIISSALKRLRWPKLIPNVISWTVWFLVMVLMVKVQLFFDLRLFDASWLASIPHAISQIFTRFEAPLLVLISTAVLWWLGRRMAYKKPDFSATIAETQLGLIMLALIFFTSYELNLEQSSSAILAICFFFLALLGVSVSHAQEDSWLFSSRKRSWSVIILVCIGIIITLGLVIGFVFNPDLIQMLLTGLKWIWSVIERVISFLASLFPSQNSSPVELPPLPSLPAVDPEETGGFTLPEWLRPGLALVWEILVGGILLVAVWRIASQIFGWMRRQLSSGGDEVETLNGAFRTDLRNFLKKILSRLFRIKFKERDHDSWSNFPPRMVSVRQLYAQFLHWAAVEGYPRDKSQTPEEFRYKLTQIRPEYEETLGIITSEYMNVRYGSNVPSFEDLDRLGEKWHDLRKKGFKKSRK